MSFNSTLVQLKVAKIFEDTPRVIGFNSTLVQLKVSIRSNFSRMEACFNSTLVQLKGMVRMASALPMYQFQFYLSSIKSRLPLRPCFVTKKVSILP